MFFQVSLELLIVELYDLQFLFGQHLRYVIEMLLNTFYKPKHFLLQVFLPLFGLLQFIPYLFHLGTHLQLYHLLPQLQQCLGLATDDMLLAVGEGTTQAYTFPAGEADVGGFVEVERALAGEVADRGLFGFAGGDEAGGGESVGLISGFLWGAIRFSRFIPHEFELQQKFRWPIIPLFTSLQIIQMQTQELYKYDLVESFINSIKGAHSKQDFLTRVQEFDVRFTEDQNQHNYSEKQKSAQKLPPMPQQKPRNPFKTNIEENYRQHSQVNPTHSAQQIPFSQPHPQVRGSYSRTEQNFYKNTNTAGKGDQYSQLNNSFGHNLNAQGNYAGNQGHYSQQGYGNQMAQNYGSGGMGVLNYNAYSQKEYDDLKQEFFRVPPARQDSYAKVQENYASNRQLGPYSFNQMGTALGMSSSTELIAESNKPSARIYADRSNPFMRQ